MNNLYEALEVCLEAIEEGLDIESTLALYPDIADELRPIIQASMIAREKAIPMPSMVVMQRNRGELLHRAAEMREAKAKSSLNGIWFPSFRRAAVALAVLAIVFVSGTGLVRASSATLPGDNLYPVKRTCEDLALLFTFDPQRRESLAVEHENARLDELHELIAIGRSARVDFAGIVTEQNGSDWVVAGISVIVSSQTDLHDGPVVVGDAIRVFGISESNNSVVAERIDQLPPNATLPNAGNPDKGSNSGSGSSNNENGNEGTNENDSSGPGNGNDNINDNNSGPGGGNDNENTNNSGPGGGTNSVNENNSGSGGGNDNGNDNNSGPGSTNDSSTEDNSGSGSGSDNSNDSNSGPGGGGGND